MQPVVILQLLVLLTLANGTPVIATRIFGDVLSRPLDAGVVFADGRPLFGRSKTIRGLVLSILVTTALSPLVGMEFQIGFLVAVTAMAGDLCSSFVKRRMNLPPSSRAVGLDQIPESLFPALACRSALGLTVLDLTAVVAIFFLGEVVLSRLLFKWGVRDRPF